MSHRPISSSAHTALGRPGRGVRRNILSQSQSKPDRPPTGQSIVPPTRAINPAFFPCSYCPPGLLTLHLAQTVHERKLGDVVEHTVGAGHIFRGRLGRFWHRRVIRFDNPVHFRQTQHRRQRNQRQKYCKRRIKIIVLFCVLVFVLFFRAFPDVVLCTCSA